MPVSTRVCLKPPPAATMSRMPAIGGSDFSSEDASSLVPMPAPRPRVNMATMTAMSSAMSGVPRKSSTVRTGLPVGGEDVGERLAHHQDHGQ